ncbi:MBG domain-containing protein [Novosphingobium terrae]|uniref:MBG domain-containing protein n=1 Tax=Novosphingobium terrae TaxID=2726189 RepID=UPI00197E76DA|nr:MBG domain-containing protein [Novosphingobium terrae]
MQRFTQIKLAASSSALALLAAMTGSPAWAQAPLPAGGTVASGQAQIGAPNGGNLTINQSSAKAIINWQSFDVAPGLSVVFNQPDASSATLNRVTGNTASTIAGQISANGSVYLINPNGIQITASGVVNVGRGFVASSLDIADADFLAGKGAFGGTGGAIANAGSITTRTGGYVGLLGGSVSNTGLILAPAGQVVIGAGTTATLDLNGDSFLQVALPTDAALTANGAAAALTGAQARDALRNIVNLPGSINARNVSGESGNVVLSGTINVDSSSGDAGHIMALGNSLTANGTLTARALGATGKGGFVETSGNSVDFTGIHVDTIAAGGKTGTWLVDPTDLTIDSAAASTIAGNLASTGVTLQTTNTGSSGTGNASSGLGDINVNSAITWSSANTLTLDAFHSIIFNAALTATGNGKLVLNTNNNVNGTSSGGALTFNSAGNVQLQGGGATLTINNQSYTLIHSVADLLNINNNLSGKYALAQTIDMGGTSYAQSPIAPYVGSNDYFTGNFNGLNNTIKNLTINVTNANELVIGMFGQIGANFNDPATVSNLGLVGGTVINNMTTGSAVGALVGQNLGQISNVWSSVNVSSNQTNALIGGLVGYNWGTITGARATGTVTSTALGSYAGGLVGFNDGYSGQLSVISNSYATGSVQTAAGQGGASSGLGNGSDSGGLLGFNNGTVTNVYSTGALIGGAGTYVGGLVGETASLGTVTNGYWDINTSQTSSSGQGNAGTGLSTVQFKNGTLPNGFSSTVWTASSGSYPQLFLTPIMTTPLTYSTIPTSSTFGTQATLSTAILSGNPANVSGTVSLYTTNNNGVLSGMVALSPTLAAGVYFQGVSALTGSAAANYSIASSGNTIGALTVNKLALTGSIVAGSSAYGAVLAPGTVNLTNLVSGAGNVSATVTVFTAGNTSSSGNLKAGSYSGIQRVTSLSGTDAGNYTFAGITGDYTVTQRALTGALSSSSSTYGSALTPGTVSFSNLLSGDVVNAGTVSVNTTGNLSGSGNLKAGSYTGIESVFTISGADAANYSFAGLTGNYTVNQLALTGTLGAGSSIYGSSLTPGTASFSNLVAGDAVNAGTVTVTAAGYTSSSGNLKAGSYTGIEHLSTISGADSGNYSFAGLSGNYTVNQLALTGSLSAGSSTYGSTLTPGTASFSNVITGDVVSGGTVTVTTTGNLSSSNHLKAGAYTGIESLSAISGADAGNYSFAGLTGNYTVNQLALNGTLTSGSSVYGAALTPGAVSFSNLLSGDIVNAGASTITTAGNTSSSGHLKVGTYTGIVNLSTISGADAANYSFAGLTGDYSVSQLALAGTLGAGSSTYGSALAPGAVSFSNLVAGDAITANPVVIATTGNLSGSGNLKAGSYTGIQSVSAISGADAGNYSFAGLTGNYTVNQLALSGTITAGSSNYGSALAPGALSFSNVVVGDAVNAGPVTITTTGNTSTSGNLKAGSYTGIQSVSAISGADAANYSFAGLSGNYTVNQLALTGTIAAGSSTYGSTLMPGTPTFSNAIAGDILTGGAITVATSGNTSSSGHLKAGSYIGVESLVAITGADAANYSFAGLTGNYTVNQLTLSGTLGAGSSVYGSALTPGAVSFSNLLTGDVVTAGGVTIATTGNTSGSGNLRAGNYTGIQSVSTITGADAANYSFAGLTGNYTVNQLALSGTLGAGSSTYGSALAPGAVSFANLVSGDAVTAGPVTIATAGNTSTSGNLKAGSYTGIQSVSAITGADAGNYSFTGLTANYAVSQLVLSGAITPGTSTYGSALAPGVASFSNVVAGDQVTPGSVALTTTGNTSSSGNLKAGSYTGIQSVSAISGADAANYSFAGMTGDYAVNQLALSGTIAAGSSTYGAALAPGAASFGNLVAGDLVTTGPVSIVTAGKTSSSGHLNAGSYSGIQTLSTISGTDAANYSFAGLTGNYTVSRAALNIAANGGQSSVYGSVIPALLYTQSGLVSGDSLGGALTTGAAQGSNVGTYAINQGSLSAGSNYTVTYTGANFAITPATLTYVADPVSRFANTANPVFSGSVTGFLLKDTVATATTGSLSFTSTATAQSAPGLYGIVGSGLSAGNYVFVQAPANAVALTINPAATEAASRTVSQDTIANNNQSSVGDIRAASSNNDVDPAEIIDRTGPSDPSKAGNPPQGPCVSYGAGKPKVCISH